MKQDSALLQYVYHNAKMGEITIPQLMRKVQSKKFREALGVQLEEYQHITREVKEQLSRRGEEAKDIPPAVQAMTGAMINMKAMTHRTPQSMAKMMIQGSTMGTIQMTQRLHQYEDVVEQSTSRTANRLLKTEQDNIEQMKSFL